MSIHFHPHKASQIFANSQDYPRLSCAICLIISEPLNGGDDFSWCWWKLNPSIVRDFKYLGRKWRGSEIKNQFKCKCNFGMQKITWHNLFKKAILLLTVVFQHSNECVRSHYKGVIFQPQCQMPESKHCR